MDTEIIPNIKADNWINAFPIFAKMAMAAPKPAPAETPNKSGDTSGFLNIPWKEAPAKDRHAPTSKAAMIRGNLIVKTIEFSSGDTAKDGNIGLRIVLITSKGATGYLPNMNDTKNKNIGSAISKR